VQLHAQTALPSGKRLQCPLESRLVVPQSRSDRCGVKKSSCPSPHSVAIPADLPRIVGVWSRGNKVPRILNTGSEVSGSASCYALYIALEKAPQCALHRRVGGSMGCRTNVRMCTSAVHVLPSVLLWYPAILEQSIV
jgi:hypothetical protein